MHSTQEDERSRFKLAQLLHLVSGTCQRTRKSYLRNRLVDEILKDDFNIDYKVTIEPMALHLNKIHLKDCTALHFLYYKILDIDTFCTLIKRGADFTVKNANGQTVLHLIATECSECQTKNEIPFLNTVLSAHVELQNLVNPRDDHGLSHLHAACIANHVEALEFFLDNGASADEAVELDAPRFAGYTPLHFVVAFNSFKVAKTLVERGANVNAKAAGGLSPLDLLVKKEWDHYIPGLSKGEISEKEQLVKLLLDRNAVSGVGISSLQVACTFADLATAERLLDQGVHIDYAVPKKSALCAGRTALHFAARSSFEAVEMLIGRGARVDLGDGDGVSALGLCMSNHGTQKLCDALSRHASLKEARLSDGKTKLLHLIPKLSNLKEFKLLLQNEIEDVDAFVPSVCLLCPGHSLLHLAVTFSPTIDFRDDKTIVQECLKRGSSLSARNASGQTPVHLAFRQHRFGLLGLLLERLDESDQVANLVDEDNLSYLHIACKVKNEDLVEKLLRVSNPNDICRGTTAGVGSIQRGATPLHVAAFNGAHGIARALLGRGADLHAGDADGIAPIHWLLRLDALVDGQEVADVLLASLLASDAEDRVVAGLGLSYLHVAAFFGDARAVERLLDLGSDVNALVERDEGARVLGKASLHFRRYENLSPLQMALQRSLRHPGVNEKTVSLLLRRGADMFVTGMSAASDLVRCIPTKDKHALRCFFQVLWERDDVQKSMEERLGLTRLHVACCKRSEEAIRRALDDGAEVDARVRADSAVFAGCTPLHLLLSAQYSENVFGLQSADCSLAGMIKLLLDHGADVTAADSKGNTPVHVFGNQSYPDEVLCRDLLMNAHEDFSVNPVNSEGVSHFHLACRWHKVDVAEKFLQHASVDVNRPIDYFAKLDAGWTALHLAWGHYAGQLREDWAMKLQTVDLLLKHGANVAVKDVRGDTPLHKAAVLDYTDMSIFDKFASYGADVAAENIEGQSPIELWLDTYRFIADSPSSVTVFQKYGYNINSWNHLTGEGYIGKIFSLNQENFPKDPEFQKFLKSSDARAVDSMGRTAIHNLVTHSKRFPSGKRENFIYAIESFVKIGINLEHQDMSGQTALHYAARIDNLVGTESLLACGANVNIPDNSGKSAFSYALDHSKNQNGPHYSTPKDVTKCLRLHIMKLQHLGLQVSEHNEDLVKGVEHFFDVPMVFYVRYSSESNKISEKFFNQIEITKALDIRTNSLTLFDFLSDIGAVNLYSLLPKSERDVIDEFFKSKPHSELDELTGIIKLQFKKMTERLGLIEPAFDSLRILLGFSVPGLCEQISRFLLNSDLKNLIESTSRLEMKNEHTAHKNE